MSKKCCCSTTVIPYCYRCKKPDGRRYRSINDFNWSLTPQGVANASTETIHDLCVRTRAILYPGGPGTYPPLPNCADVPEVCDTSPCADYLQAYSINTWTTQGAGSWREPDWPNCDNSLPDPLFDYEERCVWTASLFVHRTGGVVDTCTSLLVGIAWMRKADQSVTIGAWATMVESMLTIAQPAARTRRAASASSTPESAPLNAGSVSGKSSR